MGIFQLASTMLQVFYFHSINVTVKKDVSVVNV